MANERAIEILNQLLAAEFESILTRLEQAEPYISLKSADGAAELGALLRELPDFRRDLTEMILSLRGAPVPRRFSTAAGDIHYVGLAHLMPPIMANLRQLISLYESASGQTGHHQADALIARILDSYRRHYTQLEKLYGRIVPAAARS